VKKLSVAIMTKNEKDNIRNCLLSVAPYIGDELEVVVLDTGSEDGTVEIAAEYTDNITVTGWDDDFADARNLLKTKCSGEWILMLDADERVVRNPLKGLDGFTADMCAIERISPHRTITNGLRIEFQWMVRLYKNNALIHYKNPIHEDIDIRFLIKVGMLKRGANHIMKNKNFYLAHLGYDHQPDILKKKAIRNITMITKNLNRGFDDAHLSYHAMMSFLFLHEIDNAYLAAQRTIQEIEKEKPDVLGRKMMRLSCEAVISSYENRLYSEK